MTSIKTFTPSLEMIAVLAGSVGLCAGMTLFVLRKFKTIGIDRPDSGRKTHDKPTPRLGGLPIYITLMAGFGVMALAKPRFLEEWWPLILTNTLVFALGFVDDVKPLGAKVKLLGQIGVACILYALGVSIEDLSNPFRGGAHFDLGAWSFPVTIMWLISIPNIINLIDGMDGLASGFGLFLSLTLAFVGHYNGMADVVLMSVVMSGALSGFLLYNYPPARIFLGDGGAYLIGFYIASTSLRSSQKSSILAAQDSATSSNNSSVKASAGTEKCCQTPGKSMKRKSTVATFSPAEASPTPRMLMALASSS